jgi:hypothetical protein
MTDQMEKRHDPTTHPDPILLVRQFNRTHPAREELYVEAKAAGDALDLAKQDAAEARTQLSGCQVAYASCVAQDPSRQAPLPRQVALTACAAAIDALPIYVAAESLGDDATTTLLWAGLFLLFLVGGEIALDRFSRRGSRRGVQLTAWLLGGFIGALGLLRLRFLWTVAGGWLTPIVGALLLSGVTTAFVLAGYWLLRSAESLPTFRARRALRLARREQGAAQARWTHCCRRLERKSRAYLSVIRTFLLERASNEASADAMERAVWAHLTRTISGGAG